MNLVLTMISGILFIAYGLLCINTNHMIKEFERYGVAKFRTLVGYLELLGGMGQLLGYFYAFPLYIAANSGLVVLMFMAVILRTRLKDPFVQIVPAAGLLLINSLLLYESITKWFELHN